MPGEQAAATASMGITHGALRRDLARIRTALTAAPYPQGRQRAAIAAHAGWMMTFLHHHHGGEDAGLWPAVRAKNAAAAQLLDQKDADHRAIAPGIDAVEQAARRYAGDAAAREDLPAAVALLEQTLLPHLRREELEMMPVVARTLSQAEWDAIEQEFFVRPKTEVQLGDEGQWLIDNAGEQSRQVILGVVPPPLRFLLVHVFGPRYRRKRRLPWRDGPAAPRQIIRRTIATPLFADGTHWGITLKPAGTGTPIVQTFQITKRPRCRAHRRPAPDRALAAGARAAKPAGHPDHRGDDGAAAGTLGQQRRLR